MFAMAQPLSLSMRTTFAFERTPLATLFTLDNPLPSNVFYELPFINTIEFKNLHFPPYYRAWLHVEI